MAFPLVVILDLVSERSERRVSGIHASPYPGSDDEELSNCLNLHIGPLLHRHCSASPRHGSPTLPFASLTHEVEDDDSEEYRHKSPRPICDNPGP